MLSSRDADGDSRADVKRQIVDKVPNIVAVSLASAPIQTATGPPSSANIYIYIYISSINTFWACRGYG